MSETPPNVIVLAGTLLADTLAVTMFVHADVIAQGLAGFDPNSAALEAGRIF